MTTKINPPVFYSSMDRNNNNNNNNDDDEQLFANEKIQRYDADTIKNRYGENWRNYASNVREIKQADGSIVREYIIEDPGLLKEIKPSSTDSTSSTTGSDDEQQQQQQSSKHKFAQIKAKFEQKTLTNVMASPSSSSIASSHTTTRRNSNKSSEDLNIKNRRESNETLLTNRTNPNSIHTTQSTPHSQQIRSVSNSSFHRLNSADEADEEVQNIHRQGIDLRQQHQSTLTPVTSIDETKEQNNIQYEIVDEDGNPMVIDDVQHLIKMSGVTAREVPQPDGTVIREYVIDDPDVLSKFQSQQQQNISEHVPPPPPPPRIPLRHPTLLRQEPLTKDHYPILNIQQVRTLESQRRYEFISTSGKRIEFMLTNLGADETDVNELANAINTRLLSSSSNTIPQQPPFTHPKPWHPAVDLTHRESQTRQRTGSDNQPIPNNINLPFQQLPPNFDQSTPYQQQIPPDFDQSGSYQQQFAPVFAEPIIDWSAVRQQDPHGQIDPQFIQQFITQKHQNGAYQTSAQFLPDPQQQQQRPANSPSKTTAPMYYQQTQPPPPPSSGYPYQGQQQGVRILTTNNNDFNYHHQQQILPEHTRI